MTARQGQGQGRRSAAAGHDPEYDTMLLLDRLEELREDMDDLGITSRDQLEARIRELHEQLDAKEM